MFKIKPIEDKNEQKEFCSVCNVEYSENAIAFASVDLPDIDSEETVIGICELTLGTSPHILAVNCAPGYENDESMLILLHTVCAYLARCGYEKAYASGDTHAGYMKKCGFEFADGKYFTDLTRRGCASRKDDTNE